MSARIDDLEDVFENAPCGLITLLGNGRVYRVNKTLIEWLGHPSDQMVGKRFSDFLNIAGRIYFETHIAPILRLQGSFDEFAVDMVTASGKPLLVIANARESRNADGKAEFTRIALIKATDRRRYERELLASRDSAELRLQDEQHTSELREQFIAVLGHDLRNPLASISAGARILGREATSERQRSVLAMMEATVLRMAGLIDNILDFARGRLGGGITLTRDASSDLEPVLTQVVNELRSANPDRLIETDFALKDPIDCDRSRIGQMVSNLLGNALTHGAEDQPVRVFAATEGGVFTLWVANGGQPIPESALPKLFEPFVRGDVRDIRKGLGLGLHIASQIAKAHEGILNVASDATETRFTFVMPLRRQ